VLPGALAWPLSAPGRRQVKWLSVYMCVSYVSIVSVHVCVVVCMRVYVCVYVVGGWCLGFRV